MDDLILISQAMREFPFSYAWFYDQIRKGNLKAHTATGKRGTYVSRYEVKQITTPHAKPTDADVIEAAERLRDLLTMRADEQFIELLFDAGTCVHALDRALNRFLDEYESEASE